MPIKEPSKRKKQNIDSVRAYRARKRNEPGWLARQAETARISRQKNPEKQMFKSAKRRANHKGLEFTLKESDIHIPKVCPILGIPIILSAGKGRFTNNSPTIDRIDPSKGYTPDNIQVVSFRGNLLKSNGTLEEFRKVVSFLECQ